jgi:hypothetical protein
MKERIAKSASVPGLSVNTTIPTVEGIRRIDCYIPPSKTIPSTYTIQSTPPIRIGIFPAVRIITSSGKSLTGSPEQPVLALNKTKNVSLVRCASITKDHHLIGVVENIPIKDLSPLPYPEFIPFGTLIDLPYEEQMRHVAALVQTTRTLSIRTPSIIYAQAIALIAATMGCYSNITAELYPHYTCKKRVADTNIPSMHYYVNLVPLMENTILSQLAGADLCPYDHSLAETSIGEIYNTLGCNFCTEITQILTGKEGSVLYSDQVISVGPDTPSNLWNLCSGPDHATLANGYIVAGVAN